MHICAFDACGKCAEEVFAIGAYFKRLGVKLSAAFSGGGVLLDNQKLFLAAVSLMFAATGLSGIFINTFIYSCVSMSGELASGLRTVVYYNLCMYASMAFFSIVVGIVGKNTNSRTLICSGLAVYIVLFVLLLVFREKSVDYVWLLGILSGMASALINLNYGVAVGFVTSNNNREYYLWVQGIINGVCTVITPLAAGTVIEMIGGISGYVTLFAFTLAFVVGSMLCFFNLQFRDGKNGMTQFGNVFVAFLKNKSMRSCAVAEFVDGLRDGVVTFLIPILLFTKDMSALLVGVYIFAYSLIQVSFSRTMQSKIDRKNRSVILFFACGLYALIGFVFVSGTGALQIFSYGIVSAILQSVFAAAVFSLFFEASYKMKNAQRKNLEILSVKEFYVNMGRLVGVFVLLLVAHDTTNVVYTVIGVGVAQILVWFLLHKGSHKSRAAEADGITIRLG